MGFLWASVALSGVHLGKRYLFWSVFAGLFLPEFLFLITILPVYRVLMVWVYDHTGSLFVAMLMHAIYTAFTTSILVPMATGVPRRDLLLHIHRRAVGFRCSGAKAANLASTSARTSARLSMTGI